MGTMNISLPDSLRSFIARRIRSGDYGTSSEYVRELVRRDQARLALKSLLVAGLESPIVGRADRAYWKRKGQRFARRP